jgi:phosphoribosyl-AMP cyclohydrolase
MTEGFPPRGSGKQVEEGDVFTPKFDAQGLLPAVAVDATSGEVLMLAYMNAEALALTIATGEAHYWSRSRGELWRKGETSGNRQRVIELRTDCDQDTVLLRVIMEGEGAACHTGRKTCFYRVVAAPGRDGDASCALVFTDM